MTFNFRRQTGSNIKVLSSIFFDIERPISTRQLHSRASHFAVQLDAHRTDARVPLASPGGSAALGRAGAERPVAKGTAGAAQAALRRWGREE